MFYRVLLALVLFFAPVTTCAASHDADVFRFLLLLNKVRQQDKTVIRDEKPVLKLHTWEELQKGGWRDGGLAYVAIDNCIHCRAAEKMFKHPQVIAVLNEYPFFVVPRKYAKQWSTYYPALVVVKPGGKEVVRIPCPHKVEEFLALFAVQRRAHTVQPE